MASHALGTIAHVWRYPLCSAGGERLSRAELSGTGLAGDRRWCLVDSVTGEVAAPEKRKRWRPAPNLQARGAEALELRFEEGPWLPALAAETAERLREFFGFAVDVRPAAEEGGTVEPRAVPPRYKRRPIHLLTTASLDALARLIPDGAIDVRRFRPNLVVETEPSQAGFVEQLWVGRSFALGKAQLQVTEPCTRCAFTVLAQRELPLDPRILATVMDAAGGSFGVMCSVTAPAPIRLGDELVSWDEGGTSPA